MAMNKRYTRFVRWPSFNSKRALRSHEYNLNPQPFPTISLIYCSDTDDNHHPATPPSAPSPPRPLTKAPSPPLLEVYPQSSSPHQNHRSVGSSPRFHPISEESEDIMDMKEGEEEHAMGMQPWEEEPGATGLPAATDTPLSPEELEEVSNIDAYALDPHMKQCQTAEHEFERVEGRIFAAITHDTITAAEQSRISELKNEEAVVEARDWASLRVQAGKERAVARGLMVKAQEEMNRADMLFEEAREAQIALTHATAAPSPKINTFTTAATQEEDEGEQNDDGAKVEGEEEEEENAEVAALLQESQQLREEFENRAKAIEYLSREASQLEHLAETWAWRVKQLENLKLSAHQLTEELKAAAESAMKVATEELNIAEARRFVLEAHPNDPAVQMEAAALAERADIKATGAEIKLTEAIKAAKKEERIESALTQARRDAELLLRRAGELLATAEGYIDGQDALLQLAYEKASRAYDLSHGVATDSDTDQQSSHDVDKKDTTAEKEKVSREGGGGESALLESSSQNQQQSAGFQLEMRRQYDSIKSALAQSELRAAELLTEGRQHAKNSLLLEVEAAKRAEHVKRVLIDAAHAQAMEEEALAHAQELAEEARQLTGVRLTDQWTELINSKEWKEALKGVSEVDRALLEGRGRLGVRGTTSRNGGDGGGEGKKVGGGDDDGCTGTWRGGFELP